MAEQSAEPKLIAFEGGMDLASIQETHEQISQAISNGTNVSIDCSAVEFFDGATLQLLLAANNALKEEGHSLRLTDVSKDVRDSLHLAGALELVS